MKKLIMLLILFPFFLQGQNSPLFDLAKDSILLVNNVEETKLIARQRVFEQLKNKPDMMAGQPELTQFYNEALVTNTGKLNAVWERINKKEYTMALAENNNITPANTIETNQQEFNDVYIRTIGLQETVSEVHLNTLERIANLCPLTDGMSVYQSRSLYNLVTDRGNVFTEICNGTTLTRTSINSNSRLANLVSNGSFEQYNTCPSNYGQIENASFWFSASASPDYYNSCTSNPDISVPYNIGGFQQAKDGMGYAGIVTYVEGITNGRENMQAKLPEPLAAGIKYRLSFYANLENIAKFAVDGIGAYLSIDSISCLGVGYCLINAIPQVSNPKGNVIADTANWTLIEGTFTAQGGEKYLTIGNFMADSQMTIQIVNSSSSAAAGSYLYIDDVTLIPDSIATAITEVKKDALFTLFPNPNNGTMQLSYELKAGSKGVLVIYDLTGKEIKKYTLAEGKNTLQITETNLQNGLYFYKAMVNDVPVKTGKVVIVK